jgi:hypothetical protein
VGVEVSRNSSTEAEGHADDTKYRTRSRIAAAIIAPLIVRIVIGLGTMNILLYFH